ncbi:MAG TPA: chemotaxis protein CheW [Acidobacteriota bacterium]|nr:chemotaxis protein CheW [Acidobacteriota bacterium]
MVDMVEARKRARRSAQATNLAEPLPAPEPFAPAKPVLRSEPKTQEEPSAYYPVEAPAGPEAPPPAEILVQEPVPTESVPEDQVDFIHKLLLAETEEEEAERLAESAPEEAELELLVFQLGSENYGISIHQIAEIIRFVEPTEVPNTVGFLDGIISLRGKMIPVINGRRRLGHDPAPTDKKTRIVVLSENMDYVGILVDSASQVVRLPVRAIEPTPSVVVGVDAEFIQGVCEYRNSLIILLKLERFLQFH